MLSKIVAITRSIAKIIAGLSIDQNMKFSLVAHTGSLNDWEAEAVLTI